MTCPRCRAAIPEVAHFCQRCGQDMRSEDVARRHRFAVKPDEPVASLALMSTIMPRGVTERPTTYRLALVAGLVVAMVAAIFGALPIAILVAVVTIPLVYIVYLYDVNLWDDQPVLVTGLAFAVTFVVGLLFTVVWTQFVPLDTGMGGFRIAPLLVYALLVPIVGEAIRQVGPVLLASRPRFDDLMDGLTFGVVSGVAYSAAETLVMYWPTLIGGPLPNHDAGTWMALMFLQGFVKPLVLGTASGIAAAEFSGLGRGYDGFTVRYLRGLGQALAAVVAFYLGIHLIGQIEDSTVAAFLSVGWGLMVLAVLVLLMRTVLHTALLEAALEAAARDGGAGRESELEFCAQCEMPLMQGAAFCTACGAAVRLQGMKPRRPAAAPAMATAAARGGTATADTGGVAVAVAEQPDEPTRPMEIPLVDHPPAPAGGTAPTPSAESAGSADAPAGAPIGTPDSLDQGDWSDGDSGEHPGRWDVSTQADGDDDQGKEPQP